jgi:zinc transport system substrate-binding protein
MSPKRVIVMVNEIATALTELDPKNQNVYNENAQRYITALETLDLDIQTAIEGKTQRTFIIMHPSLGYFADDYGLEMLAIEEDGKATTAKRLGDIINQATENNIKVVLYQKEFDSNQGETIAKEIGGQTLEFEPLSEHYLESVRQLIQVFEQALN